MKRQNIRTLSLVVGTFTYLICGASIFDALESDFESRERMRLLADERDFCARYNVTMDDYAAMVGNVMQSVPHKAGVQWKFAGAFYFATTVITTIGYGHSTPKTTDGKIFCMFYALVGIPLNLVMFQSIGERLNILVTCILRRVRRCWGYQGDVSQTHLIIIATIMSSLVVVCGAWAFSSYEDWTYLDSFYYCIITLTTVGFGDFVALQQGQVLQRKPQYVAFSIIFILCGLAVVSAAMNLLVLRFLTMNTEDERRDNELVVLKSAASQDFSLGGNATFYVEPDTSASTAVVAADANSVCSCTCYKLRDSLGRRENWLARLGLKSRGGGGRGKPARWKGIRPTESFDVETMVVPSSSLLKRHSI